MPTRPSKFLGQNFLKNEKILDKIVESAKVIKEDIVLEIGAGTGNLTAKLAEKAGSVIAIEKDRRLIPELKRDLADFKNIEIVQDDILKFQVSGFRFQNFGYKVVGNIPYYLTSRLLRIIFGQWPVPQLIVLTVQKEVAQRIIARPPKMNLLAVSVQYYAEPEILFHIKKENFRPRPKVDSSVVRLTPRKNHEFGVSSLGFFKVVRSGFSHKRKFLISNLATGLEMNKEELRGIFKKLNFDEKIRAENLSVEEWIKLSDKIQRYGDDQ